MVAEVEYISIYLFMCVATIVQNSANHGIVTKHVVKFPLWHHWDKREHTSLYLGIINKILVLLCK